MKTFGLDYRPPEPRPPRFRWRNIPKLMLAVSIAVSFLVAAMMILDHYTGWITMMD